MKRTLMASSAITVILAALLSVATASSALACSNNGGARYVTSAEYNYGLRSDIDFEAHTAPSGKTLVRRLEIRDPDTNRAMGWGTYKGAAWAMCPADSSNWNVFAFYHIDAVGDRCIRDDDFGAVSNNAQNVAMKLSWGSACGSPGLWRFYLHGDRKYCLSISTIVPPGKGRVISRLEPAATNANIDVRFTEIDRLKGDGTWTSVSNATGCAGPTYRVREISADDVWLEKIP